MISSFCHAAGNCVDVEFVKSSFCTRGDCVEVGYRKSSFSGIDCVEVAFVEADEPE
jgi:hypothetical protein